MAWQDPLEGMLKQPMHRIRLALPRKPAIVAVGAQTSISSIPSQMIAREKEPILEQQAAVPSCVARRGNRQEPWLKLHRFVPFQKYLRVRLSFFFQTVDVSLRLKVPSIFCRVGYVVLMCQENVADSPKSLDPPDERLDEFRRINEPVSTRMQNQVAVSAIGFWRVESAVINRMLDFQREIIHHGLRIVGAKATDGTSRTGEDGMQRRLAIVQTLGLRVNERMVSAFTKNHRRNLTAGIAVDAGRVDEEIAGHIFRNSLFNVCH